MRPLRTVALCAALLALAVIGIRPSWRVGASVRDAVLTTPGATVSDAARIADSLGGAAVFTNLADVLSHRAGLGNLHVVGWGLDADDWVRLESIPVTFDATALPHGIEQAAWPAQIALGDRLSVDGRVAGPRGASATRVELADPTGIVDSAAVDSTGAFHLETEPRALGRFRYTLRLRGAGVAETLGVQVAPPPEWRVLVLESAPRPETTVLRDWLGRRHGVVAVRSSVSRDRVHREFVNRPATPLDQLTVSLLAQFDIVIIDGRSLAALTNDERALLRRAVDVDGLGVLLVPDTAVTDGGAARFADRDFFIDFALQRRGDVDEQLVRPLWREPGGHEPTAAAVAAEPYALSDRFGTTALIRDGSGHTLAQVAPRGAGRVALSLITGTARWRRSGLADLYAAYWSRLLAATGRPSRNLPRWSIATPGPWIVGRPVAIEAATGDTLTVVLVSGPAGGADSVFLARDASGRWRGIYWPRTTGWYSVASDSGPAFYAQGSGSWMEVRAGERVAASNGAVVAARGGARLPATSLTVPAMPLPLAWAFGLFLVSAGYLWSERRRLVPVAGSPADSAT